MEDKILEKTIKDIKKKFGEGAIIKLDEKPSVDVGVIPTGCFSLDLALGIGGVPKGRIIEIFGMEGSGKTTIASHIVAKVQESGGIAAFIDAEHALDPDYAKKIGVDVGKLYLSQPSSGEEGLQILERLVNSGKIDIVIIDSVAALVPQAEIAGEIGELKIGLQARLMSATLRRLTSVIAKTGTCVIFINQIRMKIGAYGNPETTPGGMALKFYSSVRLELRKSMALVRGNEVVGNKIKAKVVKSKVAPPFKRTEFNIYYGEGIDLISDLLDAAVLKEVVKKSGAWYYYKDLKWQGQDEVKKYLNRDRKSTRLNSSHIPLSRMPSSA